MSARKNDEIRVFAGFQLALLSLPRKSIVLYTYRTQLRSIFERGKKGELKAGEYADFIILSSDITKIPPAQYTKTSVLRTIVWRAHGLPGLH